MTPGILLYQFLSKDRYVVYINLLIEINLNTLKNAKIKKAISKYILFISFNNNSKK